VCAGCDDRDLGATHGGRSQRGDLPQHRIDAPHRLLELVVLRCRSEQEKEIEIMYRFSRIRDF
jgi:hypothetical protein